MRILKTYVIVNLLQESLSYECILQEHIKFKRVLFGYLSVLSFSIKLNSL